MLKKINGRPSRAAMLIKNAKFPQPFAPGLEYSAPARGTWNIVHTGMILPESHQIYIGAAGCLRGVVLTAAEMGAMNRYSSLEVKTRDMILADQEKFIINGIDGILSRLPRLPKAVLVFTTCLHHFIGTDLNYVYRELERMFPVIDFARCIMDPIMTRAGISPEARERSEIYGLLKPKPSDGGINLIGGNLPTDGSSEFIKLIRKTGRPFRDWTKMADYAAFQNMAKSKLNIFFHPMTKIAAVRLQEHLSQDCLYLPLSYDAAGIKSDLTRLAQVLGENLPDCGQVEEETDASLRKAKKIVGEAPLAVDASFTFRPFNLARVLATYGFNVSEIYADAISSEDEADFAWLKKNRGEIKLMAIKHADLNLHERRRSEKILALGQKAAYFNDTPYFVNLVEGGGLYGFVGIKKLGELMIEAWQYPKDTRNLIIRKGLGCRCCL